MQTIKLHLRSNIKLKLTEDTFPFEQEKVVEFVNGFSEESEGEYPPTLKDISEIMYSMVGCGVTWQLAYELSRRLNSDICKNPYEVSEILNEIIREYSNMSDEEAWQKHETYPRLHAPSCPTPLAYE